MFVTKLQNSNAQFILRSPVNCDRKECDTYINIAKSDEDGYKYLDIYMEARARAWVALGFSETPDMVSKCANGCF